ncbi:MAG: methyltransferase domain-containing protein [Kiritimatiellae bacterium]|nr:methyltransferase domain-containing protein [Kiritimatiellia bacterium]MCO5060639.1 class I SAM-dependent methyltransferase [Kiritimatiellia bacterium]MCO5069114.1 class I SAM-dependent methyltransferase [Kiritimatiellia bacterium]
MSEPDPSFDEYAADYASALEQGISVSGENKEYFARGRIAVLKKRLDAMSISPRVVMDYGCGTGSATPYFFEALHPERVIGVDISSKSLQVARTAFPQRSASFHLFDDYKPCAEVDLAFCNGVFHHIPLKERVSAIDYVRRSLKPGGLFAFCENNPWNLGTHIVMSRIPFDRDAIKISIPEARRLLIAGGFEVLDVKSLFYFPRSLRFLRPLESALASLPLGTQYQILSRAPS